MVSYLTLPLPLKNNHYHHTQVHRVFFFFSISKHGSLDVKGANQNVESPFNNNLCVDKEGVKGGIVTVLTVSLETTG